MMICLVFFRNTIILWIGKFVFDRNKIEKIIGELNMTAQEVKLLKQDIIDARIDGLLCRTHGGGMTKGEKIGEMRGEMIGEMRGEMRGERIGEMRGKREVILLLLESMSP